MDWAPTDQQYSFDLYVLMEVQFKEFVRGCQRKDFALKKKKYYSNPDKKITTCFDWNIPGMRGSLFYATTMAFRIFL